MNNDRVGTTMSTATSATATVADAPPIAGLSFRPLAHRADFAAIAELVSRANLADGIAWIPSAGQFERELEHEEGFDPWADLVIAEVGGRMAAYGRVARHVRGGVSVYAAEGNVLPEFRRRGLGRAILRWTEVRGRQLAEGQDDAAGRFFGSWVEDRKAGARELLTAEGYAPVRYYFAMIRPTLDDLPAAPLPDGLDARPVRPEEHRVIFDAENEAFRDHWGHREATDGDFVAAFESPDIDTSLWRVAWDGDEVAGCVGAWIWKHENDRLGVRRGWLERVSVRRPWRRRGLARALIVSALEGLRDAGMTEAMLGVDADNPTGALGLYEHLGFRQESSATAYRKPW